MGALCVHSTKKELDFLQLRQQLKQRIRNNHAKEVVSVCDGSIDKKNKLPCDNFGSFFGPSQHSIVQRLIEESKSLMPELKVLASRVLKNSQDKGKKSLKIPASATTKSRSTDLKLKCKSIKESRDYSFLFSDNAEVPKASKEEPALGKDSASKPSEERNPGSGFGIQRSSGTGRDLKTMGARLIFRSSTKKELDFLQLRQQLKQRIRNNHAEEVVVSVRDGSIHEKNKMPCDNFGSFFGPSHHAIAQRVIQESKALMPELKVLASRAFRNSQDQGKKSLKIPVDLKLKCKSIKESRDYSFLFSDDAEIPKSSKGEPALGKVSTPKPSEERNPGFGGIRRGSGRDLKIVRKQNPEEKERPKKPSCVMKEKERHRKRFRVEEDEDDDSVMVSTFDDILREERKSERIGRKEDEKERLLIQQEEKQARFRKAKKLRASKN
ncbi:hypothetical protein PRUPE_1G068500 [Prunus persica]|uniref:Uncharacterized protein n=2 Tax=Prunus persica TaxID=3760 RepID=A0A251QTC8_PRUPE|nr:hypothetical protein PRUPE_1G068500 [Prunus persica]